MPRTGRPRTVVLPMDEIRDLAAQGWCLRELAAKYGCSRQCVSDRMKEAGIPRLPQWSMPGARNGSWKGGRQIDSDGYILIHSPDHPNANAAGYVREHRLVMEKMIGRHLLPSEVVHHRDGNKQNNEPSNLELFARNSDHLKAELTGRVPRWTEDGKRRIREGVERSRANRDDPDRKAS